MSLVQYWIAVQDQPFLLLPLLAILAAAAGAHALFLAYLLESLRGS